MAVANRSDALYMSDNRNFAATSVLAFQALRLQAFSMIWHGCDCD